ncbi:hypothetical protein V0288_21830 [Pannus brasiliensis CCIBt3594]|uniref:Uncharacterized protein n=1 Tax=Pannus brasiliensis CCIBt3594 TaxID=1427578 RepID=A0AAW9QRW5_9CHRO
MKRVRTGSVSPIVTLVRVGRKRVKPGLNGRGGDRTPGSIGVGAVISRSTGIFLFYPFNGRHPVYMTTYQ